MVPFRSSHALRGELTWTHYRLLLKGAKEEARRIYMLYAIKGDNSSIGLILCCDKNETMERYTPLEDSKELFASNYKLYLPTEEELKAKLERERDMVLVFDIFDKYLHSVP